MLKVIICILAGLGAGVGTGFAGMSAAAVISPMLITFLHMNPYMAVGIALASDVLASAASAVTYARNRNLDIKNGVIMMVSVLAFTLVGSGVASLVPQTVMAPKQRFAQATGRQKAIRSIIGGSVVGFICGFIGAGGGMMMLLVLTSILGYELKTAVGTSVFIMSATALTGSVSHFVIGGMPDVEALILCVISTLAFAQISSFFANKASPKVLNRVTGGILVALGTAILAVSRFA